MKTIRIACDFCSTEFDKPLNEYKRRIKSEKKFYCSRRCSGKKFHDVKLANYEGKFNENLRADNRRDDLSSFRRHLGRAKGRDKDCTITLEDLRDQWNEQGGICVYTLVPLEHPKSSGYHNPTTTASLDRIDSASGYVRGNVQFVSMAANYAKSNMSDHEMRDFIQRIAINHSK